VADPSPFDVRDIAMVAVLCGCGPRRAGLRGIDGADFDLNTGRLLVRTAKGGRPRELTLPAPLGAQAQARLAVRGDSDGPLFTPLGPTGRVLPRRLSPAGIVKALGRLAAQQRVAPFGPHSLRRFYATELVERGVDILTLQRLMGHANLSTL
jgi:integrase